MLAQEYHLNILQENSNMLNYLSEQTGLSKTTLKDAIQKGALWHQKSKAKPKRLRRFSRTLKATEQLHFYYNAEVLSQPCPTAQLIADEGEYSVWFKPYGMLCQGSKWSDHCTINRFAELNLRPQRNAFIVHRLDRAASGLIVLAHSKAAAAALAKQFELRQIQKQYHILVHGQLTTPQDGQEVTFTIDEKTAKSRFFTLDYNQLHDVTLVAVKIETGRKHQIRRHASMLGFPVVGDRLHGQDDELDLQLCAKHLSFTCPKTGQAKQYELPSSLSVSLDNLG